MKFLLKAFLRLMLGTKPKVKKKNDLTPRGVISTVVPKSFSDSFHWDRHKFDESKIKDLKD